MTRDEKIKLLESQIAEANKLLAEIKKEKENEESVLAEYWNHINNERIYFLDGYTKFLESGFLSDEYNDSNTDRYSNYPTEEYAEQALRIKEFNDKLLAFKWCYDRDFEPVFSGEYSSRDYYIYYDLESKQYDYGWDTTIHRNLIYFSSAEIAQKCCDWLNGVKSD